MLYSNPSCKVSHPRKRCKEGTRGVWRNWGLGTPPKALARVGGNHRGGLGEAA